MDLKKFRLFLKKTEEDNNIAEDQRRFDAEILKASQQLESQQAAIVALIKSRGWQYIETWKNAEKESLKNRLYIETRNREYEKAEKTASDIEAINKLFASILNMAGPQK